MFLRTAALVCAAAVMVCATAPANAETQNASARCEATSFRVYFQRDSATLSPLAQETLNVAARDVSGCSYKALNVSVDGSSALASQRGQAIVAAARGEGWNATRVTPSAVMRVSGGPDYASVTMTPDATPPVATTGDAGV